MERISSQFISSLRNEKTPQKSNQNSKDIQRTPTSMSGRKSNRRNTVSNYIVSSQPSKSENTRQSEHLVIASRNIIHSSSNNPFFHSEKKSVDSTQSEYLKQQNQNKFKNTSMPFVKASSNANIINITNKEGLLSLQDTSSLKYFEQNSQRQSNGSKLFSIRQNAKEEQNGGSIDKALFNNSKKNNDISRLRIEESFTVQNQTNIQIGLNGVVNSNWRELRNRYKQQKAKSIEDQNRRCSVILQQESALDKILQDNDKLRGNYKKQTNNGDQSDISNDLLLHPQRYSFDALLTNKQKQSQNASEQTPYVFCSSQIFEQTLDQSIPRYNEDTLPDVSDPEQNGVVPVNSLLDIGFLEEQQATPNNIEVNPQLNLSSSMQQFTSDNTTHNQSKEVSSDMFMSSCNEDYHNQISINKGLINSGFSDISPISSQIHVARKTSMNKDQSSRALAVESKQSFKDHRQEYQNQNILTYSDSSDDNYIRSLQTPDQGKNSTILQIQRITGNVHAAGIPMSSSIIAANATATASIESSFKTEIESPEIQNKLKNFLEEIGYYQDTLKTQQINKIMAEITLGLVIDKAKSPHNSESQQTFHEQIEAHHFDLLKKQVEILHALCKGEGDVESEVSKKILNDVLCVSFGKKCIQTAFQNAVKRSRSMKLSNRTSLKKLSGTSTESSKNTTTIQEKDEEAAELRMTQNELESAKFQEQKNIPQPSPKQPRPNTENNSKADAKLKGSKQVPLKRRLAQRTESIESQKSISEGEKQTSDSENENESVHSIQSNSNLSKGNKLVAKKTINDKKLKKSIRLD